MLDKVTVRGVLCRVAQIDNKYNWTRLCELHECDYRSDRESLELMIELLSSFLYAC